MVAGVNKKMAPEAGKKIIKARKAMAMAMVQTPEARQEGTIIGIDM